ncbi:hypothetical protein [Nocardioides lijunqiniae]|uniref:hypothetical protein n=1 Tax=Nocardioides lijunqiniae TaxID=2760832 RepID=UPI0018779511|nr:hypothetical protein [Nocardioides lijunqiniae]
MTVSSIAALIGSLIVGGVVGTVSLVGVINSQTSPPSKSPVSVEKPAIDYGSNS